MDTQELSSAINLIKNLSDSLHILAPELTEVYKNKTFPHLIVQGEQQHNLLRFYLKIYLQPNK